jgi:hypothetical protein
MRDRRVLEWVPHGVLLEQARGGDDGDDMSFDGGDVFDHDDGEEEDEDDWVMPGDPKNRTPPR